MLSFILFPFSNEIHSGLFGNDIGTPQMVLLDLKSRLGMLQFFKWFFDILYLVPTPAF